jgi:hypothetical protein
MTKRGFKCDTIIKGETKFVHSLVTFTKKTNRCMWNIVSREKKFAFPTINISDQSFKLAEDIQPLPETIEQEAQPTPKQECTFQKSHQGNPMRTVNPKRAEKGLQLEQGNTTGRRPTH